MGLLGQVKAPMTHKSGSGEILELKFGQYFTADVWLRLRSYEDLGQYSEARFGQDFKFKLSRDADVWLRF